MPRAPAPKSRGREEGTPKGPMVPETSRPAAPASRGVGRLSNGTSAQRAAAKVCLRAGPSHSPCRDSKTGWGGPLLQDSRDQRSGAATPGCPSSVHGAVPLLGPHRVSADPADIRVPWTGEEFSSLPMTGKRPPPGNYLTRRVSGNAARHPNQKARCEGSRSRVLASGPVSSSSDSVHSPPSASRTVRPPSQLAKSTPSAR